MAEQTATIAALTIDRDEYQTRQIVNRLFHHLSPYIARSNEKDVIDFLFRFYTESELTLISKQQLKQYQEMEKLILSHSLLAPNAGLFPNG